MPPFQPVGALQPILPLGSAGATPTLTSTSRSASSSPSTPTKLAIVEATDSGPSPSAGFVTTASAGTRALSRDLRIIPLSASEQVWSKGFVSRVSQLDVSALTYDADEYAQATSLLARFEHQPKIPDIDIGRLIDELSAYLNCKVPTPRALAHYYKEMSTWPAPIVELAFERARRNWTFSKLPLIGDFARWVADELKDRNELYTGLKIATGRLRIPRRRALEEDKRASQSSAKTAQANKWLLDMPRPERVETIQRHLSAENAARLIKILDDIEAAAG